MNFGKGVLVRCAAMILLVCICATAVLYVEGAFEFSFIDRQPPKENPNPSVTTSADSAVGSAQSPGSDLPEPPDTDFPPETGEETTPPSVSDTGGAGAETTSPSDRYTPPTVSDLLNDGYKVTSDNYTANMVIAEVLLGEKFPELTTGSKFFRQSVIAKIYSDETFIFGDMKMTTTKRYTLETYMGYILVGNEKCVTVYDAFGEELFTTELALSPAYTRDKEDRPLYFIDASESNFYYIDFENEELVLAEDYDDEFDNRGLYFDYNPSFGKSDIGANPVWQEREVHRYFSMDMGKYWQMSNVSPLIAKELQLMYPRYASIVARQNLRFADALVAAKREIAAEEAAKRKEEESKRAEEESKRAEEESKKAEDELTADVTTVVSPSDSTSDTLASPPEDTSASVGQSTDSSDTSPEASVTDTETTASPVEPAEITAPEVTRSPEEDSLSPESTTSPTEDTSTSEAVTSPETQTDVNPSTDTSTETLTYPEETTSSPADSEGGEATGSDTVTDSDTATGSDTVTDSDTVTESESVTETTKPAETTSQFPSNAITGTIVIKKVLFVPRYGFMNGDKLVKTYDYARAFAFSNGRAAVIDDDGRLTFIGTNFKTAITKYARFKTTVSGSSVSTYYISSFYAPVYNDMSSLGHFYFDRGFVTVRHVNIESMFNKRSGYDETYLINTAGTRIYPPSGYNFVSCSEGIMILEKDGRYGYYDATTRVWIADPMYTYIKPFYEGIGVVGTDGAIGAIDRHGNVVIPFEFEYLSTMSTGLISAYNAEDGWRVFAKMAK